MKRWVVFLIAVIVLFISGYLIIKRVVLKTHTVKVDNTKAVSVLDLRPAIIAKIKDLVKEGSKGLYALSIERVEPHVLQSKLDMYNVVLTPDSNVLNKLKGSNQAPDNIFTFTFDSLHIDGIGIDDLLRKDKIDITAIFFTNPRLEIFHKKRGYNKDKREAEKSTLYQRLMKDMKSLAIDKIVLDHGTFIQHDLSQKNKITRFNDVSINMKDILIDPSTEFDKSRFLFAKSALLTTTNYTFPTPDSLYFFKAGTISVSGEHRSLTAWNVHLQPRGDREQFIKKLKHQKERFDIMIPRLELKDVNWLDLVNGKNLNTKQADIYNPVFDIYFDRSLPVRPNYDMKSFPSQLIMKIPLPILIDKINLHHFNLAYTEFNPAVSKTGTVYFDDMNCILSHITNRPDLIRKNKFTTLKGSGLFMHAVPVTIQIQFDMPGYKKGLFTSDITMEKLDTAIINRIALPLGEFVLKTGVMNKATTHIAGDNYNSTTKAVILYNDLHLTPLKKDPDKPGGVKKKTFTGIIVNAFLIKNNNPSKGENARMVIVEHTRKEGSSFFNFIWKSILTALLKTIGLPLKIADQ